ncbi:MAG TPA: methyltransferase domain-containing protein [Mycobacteriales bacterium]|jgi:SAM-dependent methyltransferase
MVTGTGEPVAGGYTLALDPAEVARYRLMAEQARAAEAELWRMAGVRPGARVADVGCGPGALLPLIAAEVAPDGEVVGVDGDPSAVAAATAYVAGAERVSVAVAPADATGLPAGTFDTVMVRHVLAHNGGREQAIVDHLATLLRPGGCVYLVDAYGRGMTTEPDLPVLAEINERYHAFHTQRGNDLRAGLHLGGWVRAAGLELVDFRGTYQIVTFPPGLRPPALAARDAMLAAGVVTTDELERWERELAALDARADRPIGFMPIFTAIGRAGA